MWERSSFLAVQTRSIIIYRKTMLLRTGLISKARACTFSRRKNSPRGRTEAGTCGLCSQGFRNGFWTRLCRFWDISSWLLCPILLCSIDQVNFGFILSYHELYQTAKWQHTAFLINESSKQVRFSFFLYYKCAQIFSSGGLAELNITLGLDKWRGKMRIFRFLQHQNTLCSWRHPPAVSITCVQPREILSGLNSLQAKPPGSDPASSTFPR